MYNVAHTFVFRILCTSSNAPSVTNEKKNVSNILKVLAFYSTSSYVITYAMQQTANHLLSLVVKMFQFTNLETSMQKTLQINFSTGCLRLKLLSLDFHITRIIMFKRMVSKGQYSIFDGTKGFLGSLSTKINFSYLGTTYINYRDFNRFFSAVLITIFVFY